MAAASDDEDDGGSGHGSAGMSSACARCIDTVQGERAM